MGLNFGPIVLLGGKLADICLIQIIAYFGKTHTKNLGKSVMRLTRFVRTISRNHRKTLGDIFEKH